MSVLKKLAFIILSFSVPTVWGDRIGHVDTNFKWSGPDDKIILESFDDPDIRGVTCFLSRAKTGGFTGAVGLAEDTADASIDCKQTGPVKLTKQAKEKKKKGTKVFKKKTSPIFKSMQVMRFYDKKHNTLIYMVYSDKVVSGSPKNSISAVAVMPWPE